MIKNWIIRFICCLFISVGPWLSYAIDQPKWIACEAELRRPNSQYDNPVKDALAADKIVYGGFLMEPNVTNAVRLASRTHFIWLDAEHGPFTPESALRTIQGFHLSAPAIPILRVPSWDFTGLKPYLETGILGIVVPEIKTADEVRKFISRVKYPPLGQRGFGPGRSTAWLSTEGSKEAIDRANDQVLVIVMIETPEAIANIDEIAAVPGIDVLHIGPYDLSLKLGRLTMNDPKVQEAIAKVERAAAHHHIPLGAPTSSREAAIARFDKGYRFFTIPSDQEMLGTGLDRFMNPATNSSSAFGTAHKKGTPFTMNELKSFVYCWFSLFDRNAPIAEFLAVLRDRDLDVSLPGAHLKSHTEFTDWYAGILQTFKSASHDIRSLEITNKEDGSFQVDLSVQWTAEGYDGAHPNILVHQVWKQVDQGGQTPIINSIAGTVVNPI